MYCQNCGKPKFAHNRASQNKNYQNYQSNNYQSYQNQMPQQNYSVPPQTQQYDSIAEQLRQLQNLQDQGLITQEDFDAKKKQLLGL